MTDTASTRSDQGGAAVLGIDLGTSSVKVVIANLEGDLIGQADGAYPVSSPRPGWSETDPDDMVVVDDDGGTDGAGAGRCGDPGHRLLRPDARCGRRGPVGSSAARRHALVGLARDRPARVVRGARRPGACPARQPAQSRDGRPDAGVAETARARRVPGDGLGAVTQGLAALPSDRAVRDRTERRLRDADVRPGERLVGPRRPRRPGPRPREARARPPGLGAAGRGTDRCRG